VCYLQGKETKNKAGEEGEEEAQTYSTIQNQTASSRPNIHQSIDNSTLPSRKVETRENISKSSHLHTNTEQGRCGVAVKFAPTEVAVAQDVTVTFSLLHLV